MLKHHPNIFKIRKHTKDVITSNFKKVSVNEIRAQINSLDASKAIRSDQVPTKYFYFKMSQHHSA